MTIQIAQRNMSRSTLPLRFLALSLAILAESCLLGRTASAQVEFEREPILYHERERNDPIARLQKRIDAGETTLEFDPEHGYLPAVLRELKVPESSQMLVFSKTSFQLRRISAARPRAVYFSDDVYVGWVQHGDVVEVSAVDPVLGGVFYTLAQEPSESPQFIRDKGQCLSCHASSRTQGVPGHLVRSVFAGKDGQPQFGSGTYTTDQRSPFENRWGGWYVTGTHGEMRHMGNATVASKLRPEELDREKGANITDLSPLLDISPYLAPTSDIVALMVLEHQTQMHNFITAAHYEAVSAAHYDGIMNRALKRPDDYQSDSARRRIAAAGDKLIRYLLMSDEFRLTAPVAGVSSFAEEFEKLGPRDSQGRTLRDLDLTQRLFKYPCSYLIYSTAFDALPEPVLEYVSQELSSILAAEPGEVGDEFGHLSGHDRQNIAQILRETKPGFLKDVSTE